MQGAWVTAACALLIAAAAAIAERRRLRRRDPDRIGWVPWHGIILAALFAFAMAVAFAIRS